MTETRRSQPPASAETLDIGRFIGHLERLVPRETATGEQGGDRAALAALRRGLGKEPGEAPEVFPVLLPLLPEEPLPHRQQQVVFLVASLFALHPLSWPGPANERWRRNLGASLRRLDEGSDSGGPQRRFVALLNCETGDLPHHLRGIIGLLKSADPPIPIEWGQLTRDLLRWDSPDRLTQQRWATAFWGGRQARAEANAEVTEDQEPA
jgi:CRISPR system Cascade subunit CasB